MKILITLTDGAGIRNFVHNDVLTERHQDEIILWCRKEIVPYVSQLNHTVLELPTYQTTGFIELLRSVISRAEIFRNARKFKNPDFYYYVVRRNHKGWRLKTKALFTGVLGRVFGYDWGVRLLRSIISSQIRQTTYYNDALRVLQAYKPDMVFCTHQRSPESMGLVYAARALAIPTAAFVYSWDNLPKGTLTIEADHYFVWSNYMKGEVLQYYPRVKSEAVHITGTPQFLAYFKDSNYISREEFSNRYGLDSDSSWICFSGDDEMTSPLDHLYLRDLAKAVTLQNQQGKKIQIVFRPSPADVSSRYDAIISQFATIIKKAQPQWKEAKVNDWASLIPLPDDYVLLCSIVQHCRAVFNVGSTMAIDFSILSKPSAYFKYNVVKDTQWDIFKVYRFIHFYTMKGLDPVYWLNSEDEVASKLQEVMLDEADKKKEAVRWQQVIAASPLHLAKERIWASIELIARKN